MNPLQRMAWRAYKGLETLQPTLQYLFFEVTRRCNLACTHCGSDCDATSSMAEMDTATWKSITAYMAANFKPFIVITGGEPLVRQDLLELVQCIHDHQVPWGMVSNGLAMEPGIFGQLLERGMTSLTISLDGPVSGHTFLRRNPKSYDKALEALERGVKAQKEGKLSFLDAVTCVYPGNLRLLDETAAILIHAGVKAWRLFRIFPRGNAARHPELQLSYQDTMELLEWLAHARQKYANQGLDVSWSCEGYLAPSLDKKVRAEPFYCRAGISIASILSDGTITGCNNNGPAWWQGSLRTHEFTHVWKYGFKEFRNRSHLRQGACKDCSHWTDCRGGSIHLRNPGDPGPSFCYLPERQSSMACNSGEGCGGTVGAGGLPTAEPRSKPDGVLLDRGVLRHPQNY